VIAVDRCGPFDHIAIARNEIAGVDENHVPKRTRLRYSPSFRSTIRIDKPFRPRVGARLLHLIVDSTGLKLRGAGEWLFEKHCTTKRCAWRKLHIGIDAANGEIIAFDGVDGPTPTAS